jgi:hypothetical protein
VRLPAKYTLSSLHMCINAEMRPVDTIPVMGEGDKVE